VKGTRMEEHEYQRKLCQIIRASDWFMQVLVAVRDCDPPDWFVGAGALRNLVWDRLHGYSAPTPIADIDVAFFDPTDLTPERDWALQEQLRSRLPGVPWEATNQAAVHLWYEQAFGYPVPSLLSSGDAIGTWPETATSIGARMFLNGDLLVVAPCGLADLFNLVLRRNPRRVTVAQFRLRTGEKEIQRKWPHVQIIDG
jgi:hypothetical protein